MTLELLRQRGAIGPLDHRFARALPGADPDVALGAALASRALAHGDVGVDLEAIADVLDRAAEPGSPPLPRLPAAAPWAAALGRSRHCRAPDEARAAPLVLDGHDLYLERAWAYQARLARALDARLRAPPRAVDAALLRTLLARLDFTDPRAASQLRAAVSATVRDLAVVAGGPGTGKTAVVVKLLALLQSLELARTKGRPLRVRLAAPTGKAAARMSEAIRLRATEWLPADLREHVRAESSTIHRLLGWRPGHAFVHHADNPLPVDLLVVDEASMIDLPLMTRLVDAVPHGARLLLLGDPDQLTSVDIGRVFADLCEACTGPVSLPHQAALAGAGVRVDQASGAAPAPADALTVLRHTWRYAAGSGIEALARAINAGDGDRSLAVLRDPAHPDVTLVEAPTAEAVVDTVEALVVEPYVGIAAASGPQAALEALGALRVLGAVRQGALGVDALDAHLGQRVRARLGVPPDQDWYSGRPVMITRNDTDARLYNGDVGVVLDHPRGSLRVWFPTSQPGAERAVAPALLPEHATVFATTVHKSQGSEYGHVILVLPRQVSPVLTRELLYTAVTRASARVTVFATEGVWREAVAARVVRMSRLARMVRRA